MLAEKRGFLNRTKTVSFLNELEEADVAAGETLYVPSGLSQPDVVNLLEKLPDPPGVMPALTEYVVSSKTGAVIFWTQARKCLILPPFPVTEESFSPGYYVEPLRLMLQRNPRIALILVRLGNYAIGVCEGENILNSKVGTGLVHGRHKKGGSSQQRFQRHREKQIEQFLIRVCGHIQEQLKPQAGTLDHVVYGGAWTTILSLQKRCPFLQRFDDCVLPPLLNIPEPRRVVLETAVSRLWLSTVIEWTDD
ncbi:Vms1/Ankzf1 family peptidyl-tRNA hydrolase [Chloroflexota bacterium]